MSLHRRALLTGLSLLALAACLDSSVTGVRATRIALTLSSTTLTVGQTLDLTYVAQGTGIVRVEMAYGDGAIDTVTFSGPVEVEGDLQHSYGAAGSFQIVGTVTTATTQRSDTVAVTVN